MVPPPQRLFRLLGLLGALSGGLLVGALLAEAAVRIVDIEGRWLPSLAYYQGVDSVLHQESQDAGLMYELRPNVEGRFERTEPWGDEVRSVTTNSFGFRDAERTVIKPDGVFRILALGGSNTYGAAVSDSGTWPAQLEVVLRRDYGIKTEVWNLGVSGYVTSQKVVLADRAMDLYSPDLVLFQLYNTGPRNILADHGAIEMPIERVRPWFERDPTLWREMIVAAPPQGSREATLFRVSALYRILVLAKERRSRSGRDPHDPIEELDNRGMEIGERMFEEFRAKHSADAMIVIWTPPAESGPGWLDGSDVLQIDLNTVYPKPDLEDIAEIHPGSEVYRWCAEQTARLFAERGWLPQRRPGTDTP